MTTATPTPTVKAGVSEKAFFKALGQWFSSSYAVLGELMQNAHRAQASGIHFCLEGDNLVVTDDGCGIADFQKLVQFAESGWDAATQQREDPYGMGFFSAVYTASRVIIQSRGSRLELSLSDVCEGAELRVQADPAVTVGTRVTLVDFVTQVHNADRSPRGVAQIRQQVEHRALGFPIEVTFNGDGLPRPHAIQNLSGETCGIGFVSLPGYHYDSHQGSIPKCDRLIYVQGLPLTEHFYPAYVPGGFWEVIHLSGQEFQALLPDRARLKDHAASIQKIKHAVCALKRRIILERKSQMPPQEFVLAYYDQIHRIGASDVLNDVPVLPKSAFKVCDVVSYQSSEVWGDVTVASPCIAQSELIKGAFSIWTHEPHVANEGPMAAAQLCVLQQLDKALVLSDKLDAGHWIHALTKHCDALTIEVTPQNIMGQGPMSYSGNENCELVLVDGFQLTATYPGEAAPVLDVCIKDNWIVMPVGTAGVNWDEEDGVMASDNLCWYAGAGPNVPVDVFTDYGDGDDNYDEGWREDLKSQFYGLVRGLRAQPIAQTLQEMVDRSDPSITVQQLGHLTLVRTVQRWNSYSGCRNVPSLQAMNLDVLFFERYSKLLGGAVSGADLKAAMVQLVQPGELIGVYDEAGELLKAAGVSAVAKESRSAALQGALQKTAAERGITTDELNAMSFEERYAAVQQAHQA